MTNNDEKPKLPRVTTRRSMVFTGAAALAASAIPQVAGARGIGAQDDYRIARRLEEWKSVRLKGGGVLKITGVAHSRNALEHNFGDILTRIRSADGPIIVEGPAIEASIKAARLIAKIPQSDKNEKQSILKMIEHLYEGEGYLAAMLGLALREDKRVFVVEPDYHSQDVPDDALYLYGLFALLRPAELKDQSHFAKPAVVHALSSIKSTLEVFARGASDAIRGQLSEFKDSDYIRLAWDMEDWRDTRVGPAIAIMPSAIAPEWRDGKSGQLFRGSAHMPGLVHYLENPDEALAKRFTYPHWEIMSLLFGERTLDDLALITEVTREGIHRFSQLEQSRS